jgi:hypothetical protein
MEKEIEKKIKHFQLAVETFNKGLNVVQALKSIGATKSDSIELAYELQAGEYTKNFNELNLLRNKEIHTVINKYLQMPSIENIGVFGVGEAKNWIGYKGKIKNLYGVELAYSRLLFAHQNLAKLEGVEHFTLIKGDASERIFNENFFDIAMTLHSVEPNGNTQGSRIIENVIKSASKYIFLFEPDFSTAHEKMKKRMLQHDYVRNISDTLANIDSINIIDKYVMKTQENLDNLTTCWIIEKKEKKIILNKSFICPFSGEDLIEYSDVFYSPKTGVAFPRVNGFNFINKKDAFFIGQIN